VVLKKIYVGRDGDMNLRRPVLKKDVDKSTSSKYNPNS
jgi:hypothetical protein